MMLMISQNNFTHIWDALSVSQIKESMITLMNLSELKMLKSILLILNNIKNILKLGLEVAIQMMV